ncbi:MAG TPA: hypothetical protein VK105_07705 [Virgibacillus sp.]|nr:hypothetical protein [Virgibacillus sp.]HLR67008.1 hypothetical protein [Virgibacillus sp.]
MDNYLNIDANDLLMNIPKKYYFNENSVKFIYSNLKNEEVIALSNNMQNEIIEVRAKKIFNKKIMSYISLKGQDIGWIHLENSKRLYRLPNIQGKYKISSGSDRIVEADDLADRIVKASYLLFNETTPTLLINKVGSDIYLNIPIEDFHRANAPTEKFEIEIESGTPLYKDSKFIRIDRYLDENTRGKVAIYFEELDEMRVQIAGKYYWIKKKHNFEISESNIEHINYELVDMLVYFRHINKINKSIIKNQNNSLKNIESNIVVSNELEELYLKKYLGDIDEP